MKLVYPAIFEPDEGGYSVNFPDLPGCYTCGDTLTEAMCMAQEAAEGWLITWVEDEKKPPKPSACESLKEEHGIVNMVVVDMEEIAEKYGKKAVKKTLTIPAWMNTFVEEHHISCSKLLQDAIWRKIAEV